MSDKDEALRLAETLDLFDVNWTRSRSEAADMLRCQHAHIAELEAELVEQCSINAMGAERELSALNRVRELEAVARVALEALGTCIEAPHGARWYSPDRVETAIASLRKTLGEAPPTSPAAR